MKKYIRHLELLLILIAFTTSCEQSESPDQPVSPKGVSIAFQVMTPDTRSEVNQSNLHQITLFGKRGNDVIFNDQVVNKPTGSSVWEPSPKQQWMDGVTHEFWAYTYNGNSSSIDIRSHGKDITIRQPASYSENGFTDYLLSFRAFYKQDDPHNLVPIVLEHAFVKVNLFISRAVSMNDVTISDVNISFRNIITGVTMLCDTHKERNDNKMESNEWSYSAHNGNATYQKTLSNADIVVNPTSPSMSFIAVPVDNTGMANYTLDISYTTTFNQEILHFTKSFPLAKYQNNWKSGHSVRYDLLIDNGIHLSGSIKKWEEVDYIEGTILPPAVDKDKDENVPQP